MKAGGERDGRERDGITELTDMSLSELRELVMDREAWRAVVHEGHREVDTIKKLNNNNIWISEVLDIYPSNLDSSLGFIQPGISHDVLCTEVK